MDFFFFWLFFNKVIDGLLKKYIAQEFANLACYLFLYNPQ